MKNDRLYVIIASSDRSVSLNELNGNQIGIFGQDSHWKLEPPMSNINDSSRLSSVNILPEVNKNPSPNLTERSQVTPIDFKLISDSKPPESRKQSIISMKGNEYEGLLPLISKNLNVELTFDYEQDAFIKDTSLRYNPWSKTILGFDIFVYMNK